MIEIWMTVDLKFSTWDMYSYHIQTNRYFIIGDLYYGLLIH